MALFPSVAPCVCEFPNLFFFLQLASSFRETTYFARCPLFRFGWFCGSVWAGVLPAPSPSPGSQEEEMREPPLRTPGSLPRPPGPQAGCRVYGLAHSPPRPTASTWRKFFRVKSHKFLFPWSRAKGKYWERPHSREREDSWEKEFQNQGRPLPRRAPHLRPPGF